MSGRILIVEAVPTNRLLLKSKLTRAYFDVSSATTGAEARQAARQNEPDIVLLGEDLPDMASFELCAQLKSDPATAHIPVIMLISAEAMADLEQGLEAGADDFFTKPLDELALFTRLRNLMRMKLMIDELRLRDTTARTLGLATLTCCERPRDMPPSSVLIAPGTAETGELWAKSLHAGCNVTTHIAHDEPDALQLATERRHDLFIVAQRLADGCDGLRLVSALRANPALRQSALIFATPPGHLARTDKALEMGATDYLLEPVEPNELVARVRCQIKRKRFSDRLRANVLDGLKLAVEDPLTGLYNRRYALGHIEAMFARSDAGASNVALMMLDIDRFKTVNDRFGHDAGDAVLKEFAARIQTNLRSVDLVARLGGEEFCVAMPDTNVNEARTVAERMRKTIESKGFVLPDGQGKLHVTVSVGVVVSRAGDADVNAALRNADLALYASKHRGRNRVSFFKEAA